MKASSSSWRPSEWGAWMMPARNEAVVQQLAVEPGAPHHAAGGQQADPLAGCGDRQVVHAVLLDADGDEAAEPLAHARPAPRRGSPGGAQACCAQLARAARVSSKRRATHVRVAEHRPVAAVQPALRGQALREDHVMAVQFDMPVLDAVHGLLPDAVVVHQQVHWYQHAIGVDGMLRRDQQVTHREAVAERACGDADRGCRAGPRSAPDRTEWSAAPSSAQRATAPPQRGRQRVTRNQRLDIGRSPEAVRINVPRP